MPLKRSASSKKTNTPTGSKAFLSPSYYAAAGGYPMKLPPSPYFPLEGVQRENKGPRAGGSHTPTSSESSFEPDKSPMNTQYQQMATPRPTSRAGFSNVEPSLLPSLRDTIDRMTRDPTNGSKLRDDVPLNQAVKSLHLKDREKGARRDEDITPLASRSTANLKSSFRAGAGTSSSTPTTAPSLRSVKSLLSMKGSTKSIRKKDKSYMRDTSDQDILFHSTLEPFEDSFTPRYAAPSPSKAPSPSLHAYPRFRTPVAVADQASIDLDIETRYENRLRQSRKLRITNTEASASTSSLEVDHDTPLTSLAQRLASSRHESERHHQAMGLGLGLSNPEISSDEFNSRRAWPPSRPPLDRRQEPITLPEKSLRFSLPNSESTTSTYSSDTQEESRIDRSGEGLVHSTYSDTPLARQAAARAFSSPEGPSREESQSRTPKYRKSISPRRPHRPQRHEDDYLWPHTSKKEKRKSSSCSPRRPKWPSEEDEEYVPVVSKHKSRSRSAHRDDPLPPFPPVSPNHLSDLIKRRNSVTRLAAKSQDDSDSDFVDSHSPHSRTSSHRSPHRGRRSPGLLPDEYGQLHVSPPRQKKPYRHHLSDSEDSGMTSLAAPQRRQGERKEQVDTPEHSSRRRVETSKQPLSKPRRVLPEYFEDSPVPQAAPSTAYFPSTDNHRSVPSIFSEDSGPYAHSTTNEQQSTSRESVIHEIFQTEEQFLALLNICMVNFILPMRMQNSRTWISGVPPNVARLFDWFDDIVHLHEQIYQSLCSARDTQTTTTERISEGLRYFLLKVEVYQPYVVRLDDVSQEIAAYLRHRDSDFGQFVLLQEKSDKCQGWTLLRLLALPLERLEVYQDMFQRMLALTPQTHQDYISTLSLARSTNTVIKVMTEVKLREQEYNLVKLFAARIQGFASRSLLATRERRLLHSGQLRPSFPGLVEDPQPSTRSASAKDTPTLDSPATPKASWLSRLPLRKKRSRIKISSEAQHASGDDDDNTLTTPDPLLNVQAFIFSDLVLFAQPLSGSKSGNHKDAKWSLHPTAGLIRPLSLTRYSRGANDQLNVSIEALSVNPAHLNDFTDLRSSPIQSIDLAIHLGATDQVTSEQNFQQWILALQQCARSTLKKLTFPTAQDGLFLHGLDEMVDTHHALSSLVASGLPFPRSPSGQLPDLWLNMNDEGYTKGNEREERGWWSLRYQQVFREFLRLEDFVHEGDEGRQEI